MIQNKEEEKTFSDVEWNKLKLYVFLCSVHNIFATGAQMQHWQINVFKDSSYNLIIRAYFEI